MSAVWIRSHKGLAYLRMPRARGGRRMLKRDTKNLFRRNATGGYNGRPGSAGSNLKKVG